MDGGGGPQYFLVPQPEDIVAADLLILEYTLNRRISLSAKLYAERRPACSIDTPELREALRNVEDVAKTSLAKLRQLWGLVRMKYRWLAYAAIIIDSPIWLALLARPPTCVWSGRMDAWNWIRYYFFTIREKEKRHAPIHAKYFTGLAHMLYVSKSGRPPFKDWLEARMEKYVLKGRRPARAKKLAWRDLLRHVIGNAYLIATIDAVEAGVEVDRETSLPLFIRQKPETARQMSNPADLLAQLGHASLVPKFQAYTWERLARLLL